MSKPVVVRQPVLMQVYFALFGLVWVGLLLGSITPSKRFDALIAILMVVVGGAFILRTWSLRFVASDSGLFIRNLFRTYRFGWDEVEDFRMGRAMGMPFGQVMHVLLRSGEVVTVDIAGSLGRKEKREQVLQRLRAWLPRQDQTAP
jgi:hypothetical protein